MFFYLVFVMPLCASVYLCLVVTCWKRADLLALVCGVYLRVCHFPIGILGQVWYLIVLIPDLCTLTYFYMLHTLCPSTYCSAKKTGISGIPKILETKHNHKSNSMFYRELANIII